MLQCNNCFKMKNFGKPFLEKDIKIVLFFAKHEANPWLIDKKIVT